MTIVDTVEFCRLNTAFSQTVMDEEKPDITIVEMRHMIAIETFGYCRNALRSNTDTLEEIRRIAKEIPVKAIGDCRHVAKVAEAVHDGHLAAMEII